MTSQIIDSVVEELESKLGDRSFISVRQLVDYGVYGSTSAARKALSDGNLPSIRISPRRLAVPRTSLLEYVRKNMSIGEE